MEPVEVGYAVVGLAALLAGLLPRLLERRAFSMPLSFLLLGIAIFVLPLGLPNPDPLRHGEVTEHLTEAVVIVALMGTGLRIDRPPGFRRWRSTWRLLAVTMPLSIAAAALLGWWVMGLTPAAALLLGAVLAPTDPVLASDVQVGEPPTRRTRRTKSVSRSPRRPGSTTGSRSRSRTWRSRWWRRSPGGSAPGSAWTCSSGSPPASAPAPLSAGCSAS